MHSLKDLSKELQIISINFFSNAFKEHYTRLIESKKDYADSIGIPFKMYEYDNQYKALTVSVAFSTVSVLFFDLPKCSATGMST